MGTSGFLRGCFPHFWKPTAVWFSVVKALAGAQPSGAGWWLGEARVKETFMERPLCTRPLGIRRGLKQSLPSKNLIILLWIQTGNMRSEKQVLNQNSCHSNQEPAHPWLVPPPQPITSRFW